MSIKYMEIYLLRMLLTSFNIYDKVKGIEGTKLKILSDNKLTANITLNGEKLNVFPQSQTRKDYHVFNFYLT